MSDHVWQPCANSPDKWLFLQGYTCASVRLKPSPNGRFMWQFRKVVSYADTVESAREYVEAGAEFFETFRRNPYA